MPSRGRVYRTYGYVQGKYNQERLVCQFTHMINSRGYLWYDTGSDPFSFTIPSILFQLSVVFFLSRFIFFILEPLKQSMLNAQLIAGIMVGGSVLGKLSYLDQPFFPPGGKMIIETIADVGFIFHLFILGIHIDPSAMKKSGRTAIVIGLSSFLVPFVLGMISIFILPNLIVVDSSLQSLFLVIIVCCLSSFPGITSLLSDLDLLNSDIGRLASFAAMVNDLCYYALFLVVSALVAALKNNRWAVVTSLGWNLFLGVILVYVVRPLMLRMAKGIPEGQSMKESQFLAVIVSTLFCAFCAESFGMSAAIGLFLVGIAVPDGPPLGSSLVQKLDAFCTGLLLPAKFAVSGFSINFSALSVASTDVVVAFIIILCYIGKFLGVLIPGLFCNLSFWDSLSLCLIMGSKGVIDISVFIMLKEGGNINGEAYALLMISVIITTGISRPLIHRIYDPSRRYSSTQTNSILFSNPKSHLKILVCLHTEDNVPTMINLLAASHPSRTSPVSVFILNLMELKGRAAAVLEHNAYAGRLTSMRSRSEHISKAFNYFANRYKGVVALQHFTSIAPYKSMHSDICTIAADTKGNIIILPFHKQWEIDGTIGNNLPAVRTVNQNVLNKAPCSVAILVDRGQMSGSQSLLARKTLFRIIVLFLGGIDDREALAYAGRMVGNPEIGMTFLWLRLLDNSKIQSEGDRMESNIDADLVSHFRANTIGNQRVIYQEELVKDAVGTTRVLRSLDGACELCIVGRHHSPESPLTQGLEEWSECQELGAVGDMLATSDFRFSVLVVQQQLPRTALSATPSITRQSFNAQITRSPSTRKTEY